MMSRLEADPLLCSLESVFRDMLHKMQWSCACGRSVLDNWMSGPGHAQVFEAGPNQSPDGAGLSVEPPRASELSKRINALLSSLRSSRSTYASCYVVKQGD